MRHSFIATLIFIVTLSCVREKYIGTKDVSGTYIGPHVYDTYATIELNDDLTFEYLWHQGLNGGTTIGTWKLAGNKIILNSDMQPEEPGTKSRGFSLTDSLPPYEYFSNELWKFKKGQLIDRSGKRTFALKN